MRINIVELRKRRAELHLTQEELAAKAGTSQNHYSNIESGNRIPKIETLANIAKALDLRIEQLLLDDNENFIFPPTPAGKGEKRNETEAAS